MSHRFDACESAAAPVVAAPAALYEHAEQDRVESHAQVPEVVASREGLCNPLPAKTLTLHIKDKLVPFFGGYLVIVVRVEPSLNFLLA